MKPNKNTLSEEDLNSTQLLVMNYLLSHNSITNRELRALTAINYDQAIWFFNRMVEAKQLVRVGTSSSTKYLAGPGQQGKF